MAAPAISRASGEASPEAPISAAMVSVVAAVGATLVIDAIQSPRSPTDLGRNPGEDSLAMTRNPFFQTGKSHQIAKMAGRPDPVTGQSAVLLTGTAAPVRPTMNVSSDFAPRTVGFQAKAVPATMTSAPAG